MTHRGLSNFSYLPLLSSFLPFFLPFWKTRDSERHWELGKVALKWKRLLKDGTKTEKSPMGLSVIFFLCSFPAAENRRGFTSGFSKDSTDLATGAKTSGASHDCRYDRKFKIALVEFRFHTFSFINRCCFLQEQGLLQPHRTDLSCCKTHNNSLRFRKSTDLCINKICLLIKITE